MKLSHDVESLLEQRYYKPHEDWPKLVDRVVDNICEGENKQHKDRMKYLLLNRIFLPNSPAMVNAGTKNSGLMACFVVGPDDDNLEHHVEVLGDVAAVGKRGGGAGFTGANIRAESAPVAGSAHGYAYGPNNWALRVSEYLDMITQGGFRKMALMYTLPSEHPDLDKFIRLKQNGNERFAYNFNQSVWASDDWMGKAIYYGSSKQRQQLTRLVESAHNNGEPGLIFSDTVNDNSPYKTCGCDIWTTNPCGEQPLPSYGSCNLGSINIAHDFFYTDGQFNFNALAGVVRQATRFLDNIGSHNVFPNDKFKNWYDKHRPIGIGVMGFADALLRLDIPYGEEESIYFLESIMNVIQVQSYEESEVLGYEKGIPEHCREVRRRNITTVSIAPTGSISFLAECSPSIEPIFSPRFKRTDERGNEYLFEHPQQHELHFRSSLNTDKDKIPTWKQHIDVQAAAQRYCDSGVSKTINMLNGVEPGDVEDAFIYAWESGCKGITVYRDGSRDLQVLDDLTQEDSLLQECPSGVCDI